MTYQKGSIILASDFNGFLTTVNDVYAVGYHDGGYGQTAIVQGTATGGNTTVIRSAQWVNLIDMINVCAQQQGTNVSTLPPGSVFAVGQPIIAEEQAAPSSRSYELAGNVSAINTNRLNVSDTSLSVAMGVWSVIRETSWSGSITAVISVTWPSEDDARFYFNSGGQIRMRGSQPGESPQDTSWNNSLVNGMGTVKFAVHSTSNTGSFSGSQSLGFYEMTDSYQTIFDGSSGGGGYYYSTDNILISAKRLNYVGVNGGNGNGVEFEIVLSDSGSYSGDPTDSGTTFEFDNAKATTFLAGIISPSYATISGF